MKTDKFDLVHPNTEKKPLAANLLPCPFCGGKAELSGRFPSGQYYVGCTGCRVSLWYDREDKSVDAWNTRYAEQEAKGFAEFLGKEGWVRLTDGYWHKANNFSPYTPLKATQSKLYADYQQQKERSGDE